MPDSIKVIRDFKEIYTKNLKNYSDINDSLYDIDNFDEWKSNLVKRSDIIRTMFVENEDVIAKIDEILDEELTIDVANELFFTLRDFAKDHISDASLMIKIVNKLIDFYEKNIDYEKLLFLYSHGALQEMEFFLRMDNESLDINPLLKYEKIIALKPRYAELKNAISRRCFFIA